MDAIDCVLQGGETHSDSRISTRPELQLFLRHAEAVQREGDGANREALRGRQPVGPLRHPPELGVEHRGREREAPGGRGVIDVGGFDPEATRDQPPLSQSVPQPLAHEPKQRK
jgi:hypothetical protein